MSQGDTVEAKSDAAVPGHISSSPGRCPSVVRLKALVEQRCRSPTYTQMLAERRRLPVYQHRDHIVNALRRHQVFIVAGETGSGKSTQVPQFVLEASQFGTLTKSYIYIYVYIYIYNP